MWAEDRAGKAKIIAEAALLEGVLEKLAVRAAGDGRFQAELARHFAEQGNAPLADAARSEALVWFDLKLAREPESSALFEVIGLARLDQTAGRLEQARQWWQKVLPIRARTAQQRPDDPQAWQDLGIVCAELGQREAAATTFVKLRELTPESRDENLWWSPDPAGIGEVLATHDEIFGRLVQMRPKDWNLLIARFHYFGRRGRWREAALTAARIIALDPNDGHAQGYHRALLIFTGDVEGYRRATREALATMKEFDRNNANNVGWFQILGQFEYPRAAEIGPVVPGVDASLSRGITAYREGRYSITIRELAGVFGASSHPFKSTVAPPLPGHGATEDGASDRGPPTSRRRAEEAGGPRADVLGWPSDSGGTV